jgi:hypothetical protein
VNLQNSSFRISGVPVKTGSGHLWKACVERYPCINRQSMYSVSTIVLVVGNSPCNFNVTTRSLVNFSLEKCWSQCLRIYAMFSTGHKKENTFRELRIRFQWSAVQILFGKRRNEFDLNFDHELRGTAYCSGMRKEEFSVPVVIPRLFCDA